ncbi:MAG: ATP-binding cassette domain-containing protein, partial [Treponema sp.]|nr:ATP-binding cassette domain-containing protein [Treponema sp.]
MFSEKEIRLKGSRKLNEPLENIVLHASHLDVYYRNRSKLFFSKKNYKQVLSDVTFDINEGEIVGLCGESGCGKTTLSKTVVGI